MVTKLGLQANLEERFEDLLASRGKGTSVLLVHFLFYMTSSVPGHMKKLGTQLHLVDRGEVM